MKIKIKKKSQIQEERTAKLHKGQTRGKASGASWNKKGDVKTSSFVIENKFTDDNNYILKYGIWDKIRKEALREGLRSPMMQIDIQDLRIVVLDMYTFLDLVKDGMGEYEIINLDTVKVKQFKLKKDYLEARLMCTKGFKFIKLGLNNIELMLMLESDFFHIQNGDC